MTEKLFEGSSEAEAQQRADEWIKSHPGIAITKRYIAGMSSGSGKRFGKIGAPDGWLVIVEYEEPN